LTIRYALFLLKRIISLPPLQQPNTSIYLTGSVKDWVDYIEVFETVGSVQVNLVQVS